MIKAIEDYLRENIDSNVIIKSWDGKDKLPIFILEYYRFYMCNILGERCLLVEVINEVPSIQNLNKHIKTIMKSVSDNLVFLIKSISSFRRKTLIDERIPFIIENGQIFLPFIGMHLKKIKEQTNKTIIKFSSTTQLVFLYFLYNRNLLMNTTELAEILNSSKMTASRSLNDLYSLGLLTYEISGLTGRSKSYKRIEDPHYYSIGEKYLKNPVRRVVYVDQVKNDLPIAGLEALSYISMLNPPNRSIRAIYTQKIDDVNQQIVSNKDKINDFNFTELQVWNYEPKLLAKNNIVDLVSLILSINETYDERISMAIEERLKGEAWYTV